MSIIITTPDSSNLLMKKLKNLKRTPPSPYSCKNSYKNRCKNCRTNTPQTLKRSKIVLTTDRLTIPHSRYFLVHTKQKQESNMIFCRFEALRPWSDAPKFESDSGGCLRRQRRRRGWISKSREFRFHKFVRIHISDVGIRIPRNYIRRRIFFFSVLYYIHEMYKPLQFISYTSYTFYLKITQERGRKIYFK